MPFQVGDLVRFTRDMPASEGMPLRRRGAVAEIFEKQFNRYRIRNPDSKEKDPGLWLGVDSNRKEYWELLSSPLFCFCHNNQEFAPSCLECMKDYYP